jgi:hypothetical protein
MAAARPPNRTANFPIPPATGRVLVVTIGTPVASATVVVSVSLRRNLHRFTRLDYCDPVEHLYND